MAQDTARQSPLDLESLPLVEALRGWMDTHPLVASLAALVLLLVVGELLHRIVRHSVLRVLERLALRSPVRWDERFFEHRVPQRLAWAVPLLVYQQGLAFVPHLPDPVVLVSRRVLQACMILVMVRAFSAFLSAVNSIYNDFPSARDRPVKGYLQVVSVLAHLGAVILIVAVLMDRSPLLFLSGLGAMTAILLLVFRDSILSLVAGIQLTSNNLIRVGDWIEMPQFGADGDVIDIALNSVRVQNWDRTISVIPTHKFLEHSFRNWRGMQESGGRRIKRAFQVDMGTVRFLTDEEVERFGRWELLAEYMAAKRRELEEHNRARAAAGAGRLPSLRRLTNVGTLRAYLVAYLKEHPRIRKDMTFLVRQLPPTPQGLPIEIYVFSDDTRWAVYEGIQADIFDHVLAMVPELGLRVFQTPSGADVTRGLEALARSPGTEALSPGAQDEPGGDGAPSSPERADRDRRA